MSLSFKDLPSNFAGKLNLSCFCLNFIKILKNVKFLQKNKLYYTVIFKNSTRKSNSMWIIILSKQVRDFYNVLTDNYVFNLNRRASNFLIAQNYYSLLLFLFPFIALFFFYSAIFHLFLLYCCISYWYFNLINLACFKSKCRNSLNLITNNM